MSCTTWQMLIGIQRKWFQDKASSPHYDICQAKRVLAVENGAVKVTSREMVMFIRKMRGRNDNNKNIYR